MREHFARQGFYVASLDAASDRQGGMDGSIRLSEEHALGIAEPVVQFIADWITAR